MKRTLRSQATYTLRTLLIVVALSALASWWAAIIVADSRPISWQSFSTDRLAQERENGRIVIVNVTAYWTPASCSYENALFEARTVRRSLRQLNVVTMRADMTEASAFRQREIKQLGVRSIPSIAIYPANSDVAPIVLAGRVTEMNLLDALASATPSAVCAYLHRDLGE